MEKGPEVGVGELRVGRIPAVHCSQAFQQLVLGLWLQLQGDVSVRVGAPRQAARGKHQQHVTQADHLLG